MLARNRDTHRDIQTASPTMYSQGLRLVVRGRLGFGDAEVADGPAVPGWVGGDRVGRVGEVEVDGDGFLAGGFGCDIFEESIVRVASNDETVGVHCAGDLVIKSACVCSAAEPKENESPEFDLC